MDEKSSVRINGSDGGLTAGVAPKLFKKSFGCILYYSYYPVPLWERHVTFSCSPRERILRKEKTIRESDWINNPSHSVRLLNNVLTRTEQELNSISELLVKRPKKVASWPWY